MNIVNWSILRSSSNPIRRVHLRDDSGDHALPPLSRSRSVSALKSSPPSAPPQCVEQYPPWDLRRTPSQVVHAIVSAFHIAEWISRISWLPSAMCAEAKNGSSSSARPVHGPPQSNEPGAFSSLVWSDGDDQILDLVAFKGNVGNGVDAEVFGQCIRSRQASSDTKPHRILTLGRRSIMRSSPLSMIMLNKSRQPVSTSISRISQWVEADRPRSCSSYVRSCTLLPSAQGVP